MALTDTPQSTSARWLWETTDPMRGGGSGDLAKLFKNETIKEPGILAVGAPASGATLMAREVIQNSWDAASELSTTFSTRGSKAPPFAISFDFLELVGEQRSALLTAMDAEGLRQQFDLVKSENKVASLGLARTASLERVGDPEQILRVLRIVESGTTGMYGPFDGAKSKMFLALISLGYTVKAAGSGGSYGYGKAGLIAGSGTRTVLAYSCFEPRTDDERDGQPVTRRFLGMTYWGQHEVANQSYTGFARLGEHEPRGVSPLTNEAADEMARRLGLAVRTPDDAKQLGTTFLLLDPVVEPEDLINAIERNWWPAITERRFVPIVTDSRDGASPIKLVPRPLRNPAIASFVRAYEVATVPQDNDVPHEFSTHLGQLPQALGASAVGTLGIVADLTGWSYAGSPHDEDDDQTAVNHTSLIALTRGPRMVVEYLQPHGMKDRPPYVRGVFVADEAIDDLLRQTEPRAHDAWVRTSKNLEDGVDERAPRVADHVLKAIAREAKKFQQRLRPPLPDPSKVKLTTLANLFKKLARGEGAVIPPPLGDRDVSIRTSLRAEVTSDGQLKATGSVRLALSESFTLADSASARLKITYRFVENDKAGSLAEVALTGPFLGSETDDEGFHAVTLTRDHQRIDFATKPYSADWSGRLSITVLDLTPLKDAEKAR